MSVLMLRIITAVVLLATILPAIFLAPFWLWVPFCVMAAAACSIEWCRLAEISGLAKLWQVIVTAGATAAFLWYAIEAVWIYWIAMLIWTLVFGIVSQHRIVNFDRKIKVVAGSFLIFAAIVALSSLRNAAPEFLLAVMAIVWISDTSAYAAGNLFGKHKLAPLISPGKSWEGVVGAMIAVCLYALILRIFFPDFGARDGVIRHQSAWVFAITWVGLAIAGIVGDLGESWAKRVAGVKDSGNLLPGHGGVLDRVDALLPVLPLAALIYLWN